MPEAIGLSQNLRWHNLSVRSSVRSYLYIIADERIAILNTKDGRLRGQSVVLFFKSGTSGLGNSITEAHLESPGLNGGCHFDNQLYLILGSVQDDVDDRVDVGDVDFAVTVHVGSSRASISAQNHVDDGIHIGNVDLKVKIHVANE